MRRQELAAGAGRNGYAQMRVTAARLALTFLFYAFCGWVYEVIVGFTQGRGFINRGYLFGPWLPVYGFGAFLILPAGKLKNRGVGFVFVVSTMIAVITELVTSYVMEAVTGVWLWDYSREFLNFQGRIALIPDLRFGVLAVFLLYIVHPALKKAYEKAGDRKICVVAAVTGLLFVADCIARFFIGSNLTDPSLF